MIVIVYLKKKKEEKTVEHVQGIPFLDTKKIVNEHLQTFSFDPKHLCKRTWHSFLLVAIKGIPISKKNYLNYFNVKTRSILS